MKRILGSILAVTTALLLGLCVSVSATSVEKKSFKDLVLQAEMIAVGRVVSVNSLPTTDKKFSYTYAVIGELEVLKGNYRQATIQLRMEGGTLGNGKTLVVADMPRFRSGEKVVLFVKGNGNRICPLVGWGQGLLRVVIDQTSGLEVLKTSESHKIHAIQNNEFIVSPVVGRGFPATGTIISTDYGQVKDLSRLDDRIASASLTLTQLKTEIRNVLAQAGITALTGPEVKSANLQLNSPGLRLGKKFSEFN